MPSGERVALEGAAGAAKHVQPLAIVVPAYRARFLDQALASMAQQTETSFTVYVGDDASPDDLQHIVEAWAGRLDVRYHRFTQNLGRHDLVAHWERCLALTRGEPWFWLFSDDDQMDRRCVEAWQRARQAAPDAELFRFDVVQIDALGQVQLVEHPFPARLSAREFVLGKLTGRFSSHAPEFIFSRRSHERGGVFQRFPLAWCTDDAAWLQLAQSGGMRTISGPRVAWRVSGDNISSRKPELMSAKAEAAAMFIRWLTDHLAAHPAAPGEPGDPEILLAARHWYFSHVRGVGYRFGWWPRRRLLQLLGPLPQHGWLKTWLRMIDSDRHAVRMARQQT